MRKADMIRLHFILLLVKAIFKIVRLLCDHGADIETHDKWGMRTLHFAAKNGHISIIKELIEVRNAQINARNNNGMTALQLARLYNKPDIVAYLLSKGGIM
jgi:ankyrin repeat protein